MIIKIAGARLRMSKMIGYAYEAKDRQGNLIFNGVLSCGAANTTRAVQEVMMEVAVKARSLGFSRVLVLTNCKRTMEVVSGYGYFGFQKLGEKVAELELGLKELKAISHEVCFKPSIVF
nr:hypothetical protein CFP56_06492 [Quercus suber]